MKTSASICVLACLCMARGASAQQTPPPAAEQTGQPPVSVSQSSEPASADTKAADTKASDTKAPDWKTLQAAYDYKPEAAGKVEAEPQQDTEFVRVHLRFSNPAGGRVTGLFLRPKAEGVYPCALLLHGLGGSKETIVERLGRTLLARGVATLSLDADRHGERKPAPDSAKPASLDFLQVVHGSVIEYREALDYLQTRPDVDSKRFGLAGYSMGAMMGAIISGIDTRLKDTVLFVGGDLVQPRIADRPVSERAFLQTVSQANYVGHISPRPVLIINGAKDATVPRSAALLVQQAARQPRDIRWIDGAHELPKEDIRRGMEDLADHLLQK